MHFRCLVQEFECTNQIAGVTKPQFLIIAWLSHISGSERVISCREDMFLRCR